jgi:two-component system phosphate regulon sensor histidine kinase PhoR
MILRRLMRSVVVPAAPAVLVVIALSLLGYLPAGVALVAGAILVFGGGFTYYACREDLEDLWQFARSWVEGAGRKTAPPARTLAGQRLAEFVAQQGRDLTAARDAGAEEARILQNVLDCLPDPILMIDRERRVTRVNRAAAKLFQVEHGMVGRDLALTLRHPGTLAVVDDVLAGRSEVKDLELTLTGSVARHLTARVARLAQTATDGTAVVLSLHDLTAAARAEQMRADFVANVSHELRTPLSALFGFIETLQGPARSDPAAQERFLSIMGDQADRMARLIDDLLSLSRIELDEHTVPTDRVALPSVISSVMTIAEPKAKERNVRIIIEPRDHIPEITGETDQLVQVFENLVTNAVK